MSRQADTTWRRAPTSTTGAPRPVVNV